MFLVTFFFTLYAKFLKDIITDKIPRMVSPVQVQKKLAEGQRGQQGEVARSFVQLANQLRSHGTATGTLGPWHVMLGYVDYVAPKLAVYLNNLLTFLNCFQEMIQCCQYQFESSLVSN